MGFNEKVLFVIPARKDSERFPGKSLALLNSQPLIEYSTQFAFEQIKRCAPNGKVIISSNDDRVQLWAEDNNIKFLRRPDELATPESSTINALMHVSANIEDYEHMVLLQLTNPLRPDTLFEEAFRSLEKENSKSIFTVTKLSRKLGKIRENRFEPYNYYFGQRSQELEPLFFENGLLYIASKETIDHGVLVDKESIPFIVDHPYGLVDIDTPDDLKFAEQTLSTYA